MNITRIYQGRVTSAKHSATNDFTANAESAETALENTYLIFQDAVNYHLVALAGMARGSEDADSLSCRFLKRIRAIWYDHPKGALEAQTLQESICRTLNLKNASFDRAADEILDGCEAPHILPWALRYIIESTNKGAGAIQQNGRELLPKICNPDFSGNFDYSLKERRAADGLERLRAMPEDSTKAELVALAAEMDLSWAGVKTQPDEYYTESETATQVKANMAELLKSLHQGLDATQKKVQQEMGINLAEAVQELVSCKEPDFSHILAKNNKAAPELKYAAILFMYYPGELSFRLLKAKLPKKAKTNADTYRHLPDDPLIMTRGKRGYIYKGFSALPCWEDSSDGRMAESEFDILAFKEALKTLHGFSLKQDERDKQREDIENRIRFMTEEQSEADTKKELKKLSGSETDDSDTEDETLCVLAGDKRYELLKELVLDLTIKEGEDFTLSHRALNGFDALKDRWLEMIANGQTSEEELKKAVGEIQASERRFGSQPLFAALCQEKYRPIWQDAPPADKRPRAKDILKVYGELQYMEREARDLMEPVRITAAEARYSPRQLMYSDMKNFAGITDKKLFPKGTATKVQLGVIVTNSKGRLVSSTVEAIYSAPRMLRDQFTKDASAYQPDDDQHGNTCLQPMMKALGISLETALTRTKESALGMMLHYSPKTGKKGILLNFPITLEVDKLHAQIGKAALWDRQFLGGSDEKLQLHWPETAGAKTFEKTQPWWEQPEIRNNGFTVLGIDLGCRYAAAWSIAKVSTQPEIYSPRGVKTNSRFLGKTNDSSWYGVIVKQGLMKLDGEGSSLKRNDKAEDGAHGLRPASPEEIQNIVNLFKPMQIELSSWASAVENQPIVAVCQSSLNFFHRLISRHRTYASWLSKLKQGEKTDAVLAEMQEYFDRKELIPGLLAQLETKNISTISQQLLEGTLELREKLPAIAVELTRLILPRKDTDWDWGPFSAAGVVDAERMEITSKKPEGKPRHFFTGGLSLAKLSLLEDLRRNLQAMSRQLSHTLGEPVRFGRDTRNEKVYDPCPEILLKIENLRTERVNQIAHEITAQALGLRLKPKSRRDASANEQVFHGEYEVIPGRKPVDFVVMENLSRYKMSTDKTPEENSTLMRWAHRQIVAKIQQVLTENFGIPILFTHPAYTSRFDSRTSCPGFRADILTEAQCKRTAESPKANPMEKVIAQRYGNLLGQLRENNEILPKGFHLFRPRDGGEYFIPFEQGAPRHPINADMNASANIIWRGLASPFAFDLLHRFRMEKTAKGELKLRLINAREKALKMSQLKNQSPEQVEKSGPIAAFICNNQNLPALATLDVAGTPVRLVYAKALWGIIKHNKWRMAHRINLMILQKLGLSDELLRPIAALLDSPDDAT